MNAHPTQKPFREFATAVRGVCAAVLAFAWLALRILPMAASICLRDLIAKVRLRIRGEKCAVCTAPVSLQNEFRLHPQAGWVCAECYDLYNHGGRALADAFLDYHGIKREPMT